MKGAAISVVAAGVAALSLRGQATMQTAVPESAASFQFSGTDGPIYSLAWSPDGRTLAAVGYQQVSLWSPAAAAPRAVFTAHTGFVRSIAWSPDGRFAASAGQDGTVRIWSPETLEQTGVLDTGPARSVAWSPDGTRVVVGGETGHLQVWRVPDRHRLQSVWLGATISSSSWSADGQRIAVGAINGKASIWDAATGRLLRIVRITGLSRNDVNNVAWSPHGRLVASAHGARGTGDIRIWDPDNGKVVETLAGGGGWLRALGWSPDGQWIASGGEDGSVRVWNVVSGALAVTRQVAPHPVWSLAWSPDGGSVAVGTGTSDSRSVPGTLTLWSMPAILRPTRSPGIHARDVETALLERGRDVAMPDARPALPATEFRDGGAYGTVIGPDPPFGNLDTSFVQADIGALSITPGAGFHVRCREKTFPVAFGTTWAGVANGEWAAFLSLEGTLVLARNNASAAIASGCAVGDRLFIYSQQ